MALCPKCHGILNFWNVKAECPYCGVNIPNYNWEGNLEADAEKAEIAWTKFRKFTGNLKSALFGNVFRIVRLACTFLPLVVLILPLASYTLYLPFHSEGVPINSLLPINWDSLIHGEWATNFTLLDFSMNALLNLNWGSLIGLFSSESLGPSVAMLMISILLIYLAIVFGVLNFVFVILRAPALKAGSNIVLCVLSTLCFATAGILYTLAVSQISATSVAFIDGSVQFGFFVGIGLFALNVVLNILINRSFKKERATQN